MTEKIVWIGPRESDIAECKNIFSKSITIFGNGKDNNSSYCATYHKRVDHNSSDCIPNSYWNSELATLKKQIPDFKIMYYNSEFMNDLEEEFKDSVICNNKMSLLKTLSNKKTTRNMLRNLVPIVPFQILDSSIANEMSNLFKESESLIFQEYHSSGGHGTHLVNSSDVSKIQSFHGNKFMVSPYFEKSVPVNIHLMIGKNDLLFFPGSIQIIKLIESKLLYLGADYITFLNLGNNILQQIREYSLKIGYYLQELGYRGVLGIDYLVTEQEIMFSEVNARFQASTPLLNIALQQAELPSMQEMQIACFEDQKLPKQQEIDNLVIPYSMISYTNTSWKKTYNLKENISEEVYRIDTDGFISEEYLDNNVYLFKYIFSTNCTSITPDMTVVTYENLFDIEDDFYTAIINKQPLEVKISLLNQGVRLSTEARTYIEQMGKIKNAVFSAVDLIIFDDLYVNCPRKLKFGDFTPWEIVLSSDNTLWLQYHGINISKTILDLEDIHGNKTTSSGISYSRICFWATDRLRIHHNLTCCLKNAEKGCKFCEIPPSKQLLPFQEILDTIDFYINNANEFRHFMIGGGSEPRDIEWQSIIAITKHIRQKSSKPIYLMSLPPKDLSVLEQYYQNGITEIGFNIELFDAENAIKYMPGKGEIEREDYFEALEKATQYWGTNGKVRSLIILGLEKEDTLLKGIQRLCSIGVMPILSVFRPISGTAMENFVPPSNHYLRDIYHAGTKICTKYGLHLGPDCPACQNNTLSMPF